MEAISRTETEQICFVSYLLLLVTSATLVVTGALLVVTENY